MNTFLEGNKEQNNHKGRKQWEDSISGVTYVVLKLPLQMHNIMTLGA